MNERGSSRHILLIVPVLVMLFVSSPVVSAEEGGAWLLSQHEYRELSLDTSVVSPQWTGARMISVEQQGLGINIMSVHNDTYFVVLVQSNLNGTLQKDGVGIRFAPGVIWAWAGGVQVLINDTDVQSKADLTAGTLTATFGKMIGASKGLSIQDDTPYPDFVQVVAWNNGSSINSISFAGAPLVGFELLHFIQNYPSAPLVYAGVILAGAIGFVLIETRRYGRAKD